MKNSIKKSDSKHFRTLLIELLKEYGAVENRKIGKDIEFKLKTIIGTATITALDEHSYTYFIPIKLDEEKKLTSLISSLNASGKFSIDKSNPFSGKWNIHGLCKGGTLIDMEQRLLILKGKAKEI